MNRHRVKPTGNSAAWTAVAGAAAAMGALLISDLTNNGSRNPNQSGTSDANPDLSTKVTAPPKEAIQLPVLPWHAGVSPDNYRTNRYEHTVLRGETLYGLAPALKVSPQQLMSINSRFGAKADRLAAGEKIRVPEVRGVCVDDQGSWSGVVFDLDLSSKADWVYLCQNLLCVAGAEPPMRDALTSATQYMPSSLRRAFVSKLCETLRELAQDEIFITAPAAPDELRMPARYRAAWPHGQAGKAKHFRQMASLYAWALEASITERASGKILSLIHI